jgi:hypothetical protein
VKAVSSLGVRSPWFSLKISQKRNEKLLMQKSCKTLQSCFDYERILVETAKICVGDGITLV